MGDTRILPGKAKQLCMNAQQIGTAVGRTNRSIVFSANALVASNNH
jgi:hypothetical protein